MRVVPRISILIIRPGIQETVFRDFFCGKKERRFKSSERIIRKGDHIWNL